MDDLISRERLTNKLNSTGTNIIFDVSVKEILGENVDLDDFAALMQDAIQAYKKMVIDTIKICLQPMTLIRLLNSQIKQAIITNVKNRAT